MIRVAAFLYAGLLLFAAPTAAEEVDLELMLAVDASGSVDRDEFRLQMDGIAAAFRDPEVLEAIASGPYRRIAVSLFLWSDHAERKQSLPWTGLSTRNEAESFARAVERLPRSTPRGATDIGSAIDYAVREIEENRFTAPRRVIDISGDGEESSPAGFISLVEGRAMAISRGIVINGLPIQTDQRDLDKYYASRVIGGSGAFVQAAYGFEAFAEAFRRKLIREITYRPVLGLLTE